MNSSVMATISYIKNGIASKKLLSGEGGNITIFAFDKGQSLDKHSTPRKVLIIALEGEAHFKKGAVEIILKKDDYILLDENEEHSLVASSSFKMLLVMIKS